MDAGGGCRFRFFKDDSNHNAGKKRAVNLAILFWELGRFAKSLAGIDRNSCAESSTTAGNSVVSVVSCGKVY